MAMISLLHPVHLLYNACMRMYDTLLVHTNSMHIMCICIKCMSLHVHVDFSVAPISCCFGHFLCPEISSRSPRQDHQRQSVEPRTGRGRLNPGFHGGSMGVPGMKSVRQVMGLKIWGAGWHARRGDSRSGNAYDDIPESRQSMLHGVLCTTEIPNLTDVQI